MLVQLSDLEKYRLLKQIGYTMNDYNDAKNAIECFYAILNDKTWFALSTEVYKKRRRSFFSDNSLAAIMLADAGYAYAQLALAVNDIVLSALETDIDDARENTLKWLHGAADQGRKEAYCYLALLYRSGLYNLERDNKKVVQYLKKSETKEYFFNDLLGDYLEHIDPVGTQKCFNNMKDALLDFEPDIKYAYQAGNIDQDWLKEIVEEMDTAGKRIIDLRKIWIEENQELLTGLFKMTKSELCDKIIDMMTQEELKYLKFLEDNKDAAIAQLEDEKTKLRDKIAQLEAENKELKKRDSDISFAFLESNNKVLRREVARLEQENSELKSQIKQVKIEKKTEIEKLRSSQKKEAKAEKYGSKKTSAIDSVRDIDKNEIFRVKNENQRLQSENQNLQERLAHSEQVCDNRQVALDEANGMIDMLQTKNVELQETIGVHEATIASQTKHIQELNRAAKFQPKEAQNITAEDMVRALQAQETIKHLEKALTEEKKARKEDVKTIKDLTAKVEQYEIYGFVKD